MIGSLGVNWPFILTEQRARPEFIFSQEKNSISTIVGKIFMHFSVSSLLYPWSLRHLCNSHCQACSMLSLDTTKFLQHPAPLLWLILVLIGPCYYVCGSKPFPVLYLSLSQAQNYEAMHLSHKNGDELVLYVYNWKVYLFSHRKKSISNF